MEARSYQIELYEKAKEANVIIKLNTGSGKTFIASMLMKDYLNHSSDKKIFLLVKNASLAQQHHFRLKEYLFLRDEVGFFHGNMNNSWVDFWSKDKWAVEIAKYRIIIMTAKVFLDILNHQKYSLDNVCFLIFDEVHHMAKADDYVQISEHLTKNVNHIKILGLTACLVKNVKKIHEIDFLIEEMERRLNCRIITSLDSIANDFSSNIKNIFIEYNEIETDEVDLLKRMLNYSLTKIQNMDPSGPEENTNAVSLDAFIVENNPFKITKRYINDLLSVLNSLGLIACHCIVELFLKDISSLMNGILLAQAIGQVAFEEFSRCLTQVKEAIEGILRGARVLHCTKKCLKLIRFIKTLKDGSSDINHNNFILVFVSERIQALALNELLTLLPSINEEFSFIKSEFITGHTVCQYPKKLEMSAKQQNDILNRFRDQKLNVLVATNVVEEGLDIPHCNVVIKFDPPAEFRSYLQSKGRARAIDSQYVVFVESKLFAQTQFKLSFFDKVNEIINKNLKTRAVGIDDESAEESIESYDDDDDANVMNYKISTTDYMPYGRSGPRITLNSAAGVLNRYIGKLRCNSLSEIKIRYSIEELKSRMFEATLWLPMPSPYLDEIKSGLHMNKRVARRYANLAACKILHELEELDANLLPYNRLELDDEIVSAKEPGVSEIGQYEKYIANKLRSDFQQLSEATDTLYLYSIRYSPQVFLRLGFEDFAAFDMSSSIGILLPKPLHNSEVVATFPIYLVGGQCSAKIVFEEKITISSIQLNTFLKCHEALFKIYAQRIRKFCQNILYSPSESKCPLLITVLRDFRIDFPAVESIVSKEFVVNLTANPQSTWAGSVIRPTYLKKEFGAYIITKVCTDLNPSSVMKNTDSKVETAITFRDYYEKKYQLNISDDELQTPLISVKRLTTIQSCISKEKRTLKESRRLQAINLRETVFIPSLTECISLSSSIWTHLCIFPTIHFRLNQILTIQDFTATLDFMELSPSTEAFEIDFDDCYHFENILSLKMDTDTNTFVSNIYPCFVSKTCNDRLDLEQYEILGDSFLKFITTKYLYHFSKSTDSEGKLTQMRSKLISNNNLFKLAQTKQLSNYMSFTCFDPKMNYLPPNFVVLSSDSARPCDRNDRGYMFYKSKCLADCAEALIGSVFTNYGIDYAIKLLLWMDMQLLPADYHDDIFEIIASPPTLFCKNPLEEPDIPLCILELEAVLKYEFKYKAYAVQAITHPTSIENRKFSCYQRLEFLGDAVLDFLVTSYIMVKNPKMRPGKVTNLRSALVNNNTFAFLSATWGFHKFLNHFDSKMFIALPDVVNQLIENNLDSDTLFLKKSEHYKVIVKVLGDIFESIAGAIFVDSDYNLDLVWSIFERLMEDPLKRFSNHIPTNKIAVLYEKYPGLKCSYESEAGTNLMILTATLPDGRVFVIKENNKTLCKLSLVQELLV